MLADEEEETAIEKADACDLTPEEQTEWDAQETLGMLLQARAARDATMQMMRACAARDDRRCTS